MVNYYTESELSTLRDILPRRRKPNVEKRKVIIGRILELIQIPDEDIDSRWGWIRQEIKDLAREMDKVGL